MLQKLYSVNYCGNIYNIFAFSEQDAIRKAKSMYDEKQKEGENQYGQLGSN